MSREVAIMGLMPIAARVAGQFVNRHGRIQYPEALSAATLGLIEAVDTKDPDRSAPLEAFACMKMKWQIGQDFRAQFMPRRKHAQYVSIEQINPSRFAVEDKPKDSPESLREAMDAAILALKPLYRGIATDYFYGLTQNVRELARQTGRPLMTCRRAVVAARRELMKQLAGRDRT